MPEALVINEIYLSLQGESSFAGWPCIFIRLTACNLRCSYCDTAYAFSEGRRMSLQETLAQVHRLAEPWEHGDTSAHSGRAELPPGPASRQGRPITQGSPPRLPLVELTGGEPLLQAGALPLMRQLCDDGLTVLLETSGALDISAVDARVRRIMDLKCPSSGEVERNRPENIAQLKDTDEVKFVIGTREDYEWAKGQIAAHDLAARCQLLMSWVEPLAAGQQHPSLKAQPPGQTAISRRELAQRIISDALPVRFQVQMHKVIWPPEQRGV